MMHHQISQGRLRRPNGFPATGSLMLDGRGRGRLIEVTPDRLLGRSVDLTGIILVHSARSEGGIPARWLSHSPTVIQEVDGLNQDGRPGPREAPADDRPVSQPQGRRLACRRVFPEPGQECIVSWEQASGLLARRLAHPERLQKSHRLRCYAQVYEATAPHRIEELAAAILGDASLVAELHPLTAVLATRLGLTLTAPSQAIRPRPRRDPGVLLAGDRLVRVCAADDPTADEPPRHTIPRGTGLVVAPCLHKVFANAYDGAAHDHTPVLPQALGTAAQPPGGDLRHACARACRLAPAPMAAAPRSWTQACRAAPLGSHALRQTG